jgi:palmitoyltransferase
MDDLLRTTVVAVNKGGLSIAGVGMLTAATTLLPFGLLAYHCYLIWAGMTTNESQKWSDLGYDIGDGFVFRASREELKAHNQLRTYTGHIPAYLNGSTSPPIYRGEMEDEPYVPWPVRSDKIIVRTYDKQPPFGQEALWNHVWSLHDVDNIYDLGGWHNSREMLKGG